MRHELRVKERPQAVGLDAFHEKVWYPVCQIQIVRTARVVACVVPEFEKIVDVGVPGFEIDTAGTFAFAALIYSRDRRIKRLEPRHDTVRVAVCPPNQRPS